MGVLMVIALLLVLAGWLVQPCEYEDSNGCTWYAQVQGNQEGSSFTTLPNGALIYW